jgi:hypothetical protein
VEELPELQTEELQDNWLQRMYDELNTGNARLSINNRIRINPDYNSALFSLQGRDKELKLNLNLSTMEERPLYANFQLHKSSTKSLIREFSLGSITPAWGMGTVFKKSSPKGNLFRLGNAGSPERVNPMGAGMVLGNAKLSAFAVAAQEQRSVVLKEGEISTLYVSKREDLSKTRERLACAGMEAKLSGLRLGVLGYVQSYDYPFSNPDYARHMEAVSFDIRVDAKAMQGACEATIIEGKPALKAVLGITDASFKQELGYTTYQNVQFPAYAARSGILSNQGKRCELSWDMDIPLSKTIKLSLRNALSRNHDSLKSPVWLARNILFISCAPKDTKLSIQISRYDRELIAYADSSYQSSLPVHYRSNIKISHQLNKLIGVCFSYRYHYEDQLKKKRNSFYWENKLVGTHKKTTLQAGLRCWQSLHSIAIPDADLGDANGINLATSEDNRVFAKLSYRFRSFHLSTELQQSWLDGCRSIYINVGT